MSTDGGRSLEAASPKGGLLGKKITRIIDGGAVLFELHGLVTSSLVHPLYGQLFSCRYTNVVPQKQEGAGDAAYLSERASSSGYRLFSLENCSELAFPADLEPVPGATSSDCAIYG